jgi:hypothetical protein
LKRWGLFAGILLSLLAVAGLVFWETTGRSKLLMDSVVVASADIGVGTILKEDMLTTALIPKDSVIAAGFRADRREEIVGMKTAWPVSARQQISSDMFAHENDYLKDGESFFVIPEGWIAMRSSALRRGDTVEIASALGDGTVFGRYRLAFVKDEEELEVRNMGTGGELISETLKPPDRTDSNSVIDHVEIIATKSAYEAIRSFAMESGFPSLLLIQREDAK